MNDPGRKTICPGCQTRLTARWKTCPVCGAMIPTPTNYAEPTSGSGYVPGAPASVVVRVEPNSGVVRVEPGSGYIRDDAPSGGLREPGSGFVRPTDAPSGSVRNEAPSGGLREPSSASVRGPAPGGAASPPGGSASAAGGSNPYASAAYRALLASLQGGGSANAPGGAAPGATRPGFGGMTDSPSGNIRESSGNIRESSANIRESSGESAKDVYPHLQTWQPVKGAQNPYMNAAPPGGYVASEGSGEQTPGQSQAAADQQLLNMLRQSPNYAEPPSMKYDGRMEASGSFGRGADAPSGNFGGSSSEPEVDYEAFSTGPGFNAGANFAPAPGQPGAQFGGGQFGGSFGRNEGSGGVGRNEGSGNFGGGYNPNSGGGYGGAAPGGFNEPGPKGGPGDAGGEWDEISFYEPKKAYEASGDVVPARPVDPRSSQYREPKSASSAQRLADPPSRSFGAPPLAVTAPREATPKRDAVSTALHTGGQSVSIQSYWGPKDGLVAPEPAPPPKPKSSAGLYALAFLLALTVGGIALLLSGAIKPLNPHVEKLLARMGVRVDFGKPSVDPAATGEPTSESTADRAKREVAGYTQFVKSSNVQQRVSAAEALAAYGPASVDLLSQLLKDDSALVRATTLKSIAKIGPDAEPLVPQLTEMLRTSRDPTTTDFAEIALGKIGPAALPETALLLNAEEPHVRAAAANALARMGAPAKSAASQLVSLLGDSSQDVRMAAAAALGNVDDPKLVEQLAGELDAPEAARRDGVVRALGAMGPTALPAAERLAELLVASKPDRPAVKSALSKIGAGAAPALVAKLATAQDEVQDAVVDTLVEMGPDAVDAVAAGLTAVSPQTKIGAALVLAGLGKKASKALPALEKAAKDSNRDVRSYVQEAINKVKP